MSETNPNESQPPSLDELAKFSVRACKKITFLKKLNRLMAIFFAVAIILLGVVYYQYYKEHIATEFMFGVDEETNKLVTIFASQDNEIAQKLVPAYKSEFEKITAKHADEWLALMKNEVQQLSKNPEINAALERVEQQTLNKLSAPDGSTIQTVIKAFPHLKDAGKQKKALEQIKNESPELLAALKNKYAQKSEGPTVAPVKSQNKISSTARDDLLRTFLHNLQMALDRGELQRMPAAASPRKGGQ